MVVAGVNHAGVNHAGVNDAGSAVTTPDTRPADGDNDELDITVDFTDAAIRRLFERIIDEARSAERLAMYGEQSPEGGDSK